MTEPMSHEPAQEPQNGQEPPEEQDLDYQPPPRREAAQGDADDQDADGREDERPGRREARYRRERNEARTQIAALEQRVETLVALDVARIASDTLDDGSDLILFMADLAEVLDEESLPDPDKIAEAAQQLVDWKPGLAKGARVPTPNFGQGRRPAADQGSGASWGSVLRGRD